MKYSNAIARLPSNTCGQGLTTSNFGAPDAHRTRAQFDAYVNALLELGLTVTILPPLPSFPDSHFVEDTAVVGPEFAFITHPGAPSRQGETATITPILSCFRPIERMSAQAHMDGGDVLMVGKRFFVGLTSRTDEAGVSEFASFVEKFGYSVDAIEVSAGLHLKSIVNYVGRNTLLLNEEGSRHPAFAGFDHIILTKEEEYAGNTLWINDTLITPAGYANTLAKLQTLGLNIIQLDTSEFKKMDGGLTCLSLRF
jgi:dimethylargininase